MKRKINHCFASALYQGRIKSDMKQQAVADFLGRTKRWYQKIGVENQSQISMIHSV